MAIEYKWSITSMSCYPQYEGETDVVISATWNCIGNQTSDDKTFSASQIGGVSFNVSQLTDFIPYQDLTEDQVLNWCFETNPTLKENTETAVANSIEAQINPPIVYPPLPWNPVPNPLPPVA